MPLKKGVEKKGASFRELSETIIIWKGKTRKKSESKNNASVSDVRTRRSQGPLRKKGGWGSRSAASKDAGSFRTKEKKDSPGTPQGVERFSRVLQKRLPTGRFEGGSKKKRGKKGKDGLGLVGKGSGKDRVASPLGATCVSEKKYRAKKRGDEEERIKKGETRAGGLSESSHKKKKKQKWTTLALWGGPGGTAQKLRKNSGLGGQALIRRTR